MAESEGGGVERKAYGWSVCLQMEFKRRGGCSIRYGTHLYSSARESAMCAGHKSEATNGEKEPTAQKDYFLGKRP